MAERESKRLVACSLLAHIIIFLPKCIELARIIFFSGGFWESTSPKHICDLWFCNFSFICVVVAEGLQSSPEMTTTFEHQCCLCDQRKVSELLAKVMMLAHPDKHTFSSNCQKPWTYIHFCRVFGNSLNRNAIFSQVVCFHKIIIDFIIVVYAHIIFSTLYTLQIAWRCRRPAHCVRDVTPTCN